MKPAAFEYHAPESVDDAVGLLSSHEDAKVLAGGQSLVPMMSFRLARPAAIVDINGISDLDYIRSDGGALQIGATARQTAVEESSDVGAGRRSWWPPPAMWAIGQFATGGPWREAWRTTTRLRSIRRC